MRWLGAVAIVTVAALCGAEARAAEPDAVLAGERTKYRPLSRMRPGGFTLDVPFSAAGTIEHTGAFPIDRDQTSFEPGTVVDTRLRLGARFDTGARWSPLIIRAEYEHDLVTGVVSGGEPDLDGIDYPGDEPTDHQLRKAYGRVTFGPFLTLGGGFMTSDWGLGLVANGGDRVWTPGSAHFADPRGGDRVLRGLVATGPWTDARITLLVGFDDVRDDDIRLEDDEATQWVGALVFGQGQPNTAGVYAARRRQQAPDGDEIEALALDVYGKWSDRVGGLDLVAEIEAVWISGDTDLGPTTDFERHDLQQLGVASRISLGGHRAGTVLDVVFASGDRNFDDDAQNGFKADPNFEMGLLLFPQVLAAYSARAPVTASNPDLIGLPSEDLDRLPTRGSVTNTLAIFPRGWWRPIDGLEIYGGPLVAFAPVEPADPFNARLAGGEPRNALDGDPGRYLGTELDLGVRYRAILYGTELGLGLEGAGFWPGPALTARSGEAGDAIFGGRIIAEYRL